MFKRALVASAVLLAAHQNAHAAQNFAYCNYSLFNDVGIIVSGPGVTYDPSDPAYYNYFGAGQVDLVGQDLTNQPNCHNAAYAGKTLISWDIDLVPAILPLVNSGPVPPGPYKEVYTPATALTNVIAYVPSLTATQIGQIGGLMRWGDEHINQSIYTSPAVQLAIWDIEYENLATPYTFSAPTATQFPGEPAALAAAQAAANATISLAATLVSEVQPGGPIGPNSVWDGLVEQTTNPTNAVLAVFIPEPGGISLLIASFLSLILFRTSRRGSSSLRSAFAGQGTGRDDLRAKFRRLTNRVTDMLN